MRLLSNKTTHFIIYLIVLFIPIFTPLLGVKLSLFTYCLLVALVIALSLSLIRLNFALFVPSLFFALAYSLRFMSERFINLTGLNYPGTAFLIPIVVYLLFIIAIRRIREEITWLKTGSIDKPTVYIIVFLVIISSGALVIWASLTKRDLTVFSNALPDYSLPVLILSGFGFALSNAVVEELLGRGILWNGFEKVFPNVTVTVLLQAVVFSIWHYNGFPGGIPGVIMVFLWSVVLGILRYRSRGLVAPIIAHFFCDATIFTILVLMF